MRPLRRRRRPLARHRLRFKGKNIFKGQVEWMNQPKRRVQANTIRKALKSHNYAQSLKSSFDFNGLVALAGLWVVWNTFLVSIVPNTFLLDLVNNVGNGRKLKRGGRSFQRHQPDLEDIIEMLNHSNKSLK